MTNAPPRADARPPRIGVVVALDRRRTIGRAGGLPWHLPADLRNFRAITLGKPIIMGRRTHESIGRVLPGRRNLVVSRRPDYVAANCETYLTLAAALAACADCAEAMIIGGAELYAEALAFADRLYLTEVEADVEGDVHFPAYDARDWRELSVAAHPADDANAYPYRFRVLERIDRART